jgi:hypothetical protein
MLTPKMNGKSGVELTIKERAQDNTAVLKSEINEKGLNF